MTQQLEFIEHYNAVKVPEPFVTMDAIDEEVGLVKDKFFDQIVSSLGLSRLAVAATFNMDIRMLMSPIESLRTVDTVHGTDDFIDEIAIEGVQPLATAFRYRNDLNFQVILFAKYPLLPKAIDTLTEMHNLDGVVGNTSNLPN